MKMQKFVMFENKYLKDKNIVKLEIIVITQENMWEVLHIAYAIQNILYLKKFLYNGLYYGYDFIIKGFAEEFFFFNYLFRRKHRKYVTFTGPIEKEKKLQKYILHIAIY